VRRPQSENGRTRRFDPLAPGRVGQRGGLALLQDVKQFAVTSNVLLQALAQHVQWAGLILTALGRVGLQGTGCRVLVLAEQRPPQ
jgi:hypothetical protein